MKIKKLTRENHLKILIKNTSNELESYALTLKSLSIVEVKGININIHKF